MGQIENVSVFWATQSLLYYLSTAGVEKKQSQNEFGCVPIKLYLKTGGGPVDVS